MTGTLSKILITIASLGTTGFGIWHFFVPSLWKWYSYMDKNATELIVAIQATNVFFSLSLVLFGLLNLLMAFGEKKSFFAIVTVLSLTVILWITRVIMQLVFPQGSMNPVLQYGMLGAFIFIALCYVIALILNINYSLK